VSQGRCGSTPPAAPPERHRSKLARIRGGGRVRTKNSCRDAGIPARVIDELMGTSAAATASWTAAAGSARAIDTRLARWQRGWWTRSRARLQMVLIRRAGSFRIGEPPHHLDADLAGRQRTLRLGAPLDLGEPQASGDPAAGGVGLIVHDLQPVDVWERERLIHQRRCGCGGQATAGIGGMQPVADLRPSGADLAHEPTAADDRVVGGDRVLIGDPGLPVLLALGGEPDGVVLAVAASPRHPWQQVLQGLRAPGTA
jgi:hypothetical protein